MATYANPNQFKIGPIPGSLSGRINNNVVFATIDPASSNAALIKPGSPVRLKDVSGANIVVDSAAATDTPYGVVVFSAQKNTYVAGDVVQVACFGSHVNLETGGTVARGAKLKFTTAGIVTTHASTNAIIGRALGKASASGETILVEIAPEISQ